MVPSTTPLKTFLGFFEHLCGGLANRPVRNVGFLHSSAFILLLTFHEDFLLSFQSDMAAYKSDDG
jgi:hypothetical protein